MGTVLSCYNAGKNMQSWFFKTTDQPPKYDPEDEWMPGTAYPKRRKEDFKKMQRIPPKNQNIMRENSLS